MSDTGQHTPADLAWRATPDGARHRWITADLWGDDCGESRIRRSSDHHVLEGLRWARQDVRVLLARIADLERKLDGA